jgi:shikimate kinase
MKLIIIGPMASGKSVVGKKLSKRMGLNFFDTDEQIEQKAGVTISWIFDVEGEEKFRDRESEILSTIIKEDNCIISTGGGIVLREENRALLKKGTGIYLKTSIQSQLERTMNDKERPLLQNIDNKEEALREIAKLRNPIYESCSEITIEETNSPNDAVDKIVEKLKNMK